jgi:hypothetical protein
MLLCGGLHREEVECSESSGGSSESLKCALPRPLLNENNNATAVEEQQGDVHDAYGFNPERQPSLQMERLIPKLQD